MTYLALYYSTVYTIVTSTIPAATSHIINWRSVGWIGRHLISLFTILTASTSLYILLMLTVLSGILAGLAFVGSRVQMPLGGAVAVALGMSIAVVGMIVLLFIWMDMLRKAREGYVPAPTAIYDRDRSVSVESLNWDSKDRRLESDASLKRRLTTDS